MELPHTASRLGSRFSLWLPFFGAALTEPSKSFSNAASKFKMSFWDLQQWVLKGKLLLVSAWVFFPPEF